MTDLRASLLLQPQLSQTLSLLVTMADRRGIQPFRELPQVMLMLVTVTGLLASLLRPNRPLDKLQEPLSWYLRQTR